MNLSENPYSAPEAPVADQADELIFAEKIQGKINRAVIAGVVSGVITFLFAGLVVVSASGLPKESVVFLGDFLLVAGLTYGIYRRSRACAVAMFVYSLLFKIFLIALLSASDFVAREAQIGTVVIISIGCIFLYYYFQGILGTFAYRKHLKATLAK